jgi:hypothetical protein
MIINFRQTLILMLIMSFTASCTVSEIIDAERTALDIASLNISENLLLDIGIIRFEGGVPEDNDADKTGIYQEIREAESRYFPYHIKTTLEKTRYWGSVRVIPSKTVITDVIVTGRVLRSDGENVSI